MFFVVKVRISFAKNITSLEKLVFINVTSATICDKSQSSSLFHALELVAEVQVEVRYLGVITITQRATERTKHRVIVIGSLHTNQGTPVEQVPHLVCLLATCHTQQDVVVVAHALLCL